jgi:hypothetical protein
VNIGRKIYIHIPSDACFNKDKLNKSFKDFKDFLENYFPEYMDVDMYCDSWLLAPELKTLLDKESNIIYFQSKFEIIKEEIDSDVFLEWIYLRKDIPFEKLPESTSLQKKVKEHVLEGGKIGWTLGRLKEQY